MFAYFKIIQTIHKIVRFNHLKNNIYWIGGNKFMKIRNKITYLCFNNIVLLVQFKRFYSIDKDIFNKNYIVIEWKKMLTTFSNSILKK